MKACALGFELGGLIEPAHLPFNLYLMFLFPP